MTSWRCSSDTSSPIAFSMFLKSTEVTHPRFDLLAFWKIFSYSLISSLLKLTSTRRTWSRTSNPMASRNLLASAISAWKKKCHHLKRSMIHALWLVLPYDLLADRRINDVTISNKRRMTNRSHFGFSWLELSCNAKTYLPWKFISYLFLGFGPLQFLCHDIGNLRNGVRGSLRV